MLWALIGLAAAEACLVHLLVALLWSGWAALVLSVPTIAGVVWLLRLIRSFGRLPVTVSAHEVVMRAGCLRAVRFAPAAVAGIEDDVRAKTLKDRGVLRLSLLAHPNLLVRLHTPVALGRRRIDRVAHRLDDPRAFRTALGR